MSYLKNVRDEFTEEECSIEHRIFIAWSMRLAYHNEAVNTERSRLVHGLIYHHQPYLGYMF